MQTSAVSSTGVTPTTDRALAGLRSDDFFKLLVTELRQQDPFQPAKTADMIGQVSQIRSIELSKQLTDALTQMSQQQRALGASELLGKYVVANVPTEDGQSLELTGIVTGIRFDAQGNAILELDSGQAVPAALVTRISTSAAVGTPGASNTAGMPSGAATAGTAAPGSSPTNSGSAAPAAAKAPQTAKPIIDLFPWLDASAAIQL